MSEKVTDEIEVLRSSGSELAESQIMFLDAPADGVSGVVGSETDQPAFPAFRQGRGIRSNPVGVVSELLMKGGQFTDGSIDIDGFFRAMKRPCVALNGFAKAARCVRMSNRGSLGFLSPRIPSRR